MEEMTIYRGSASGKTSIFPNARTVKNPIKIVTVPFKHLLKMHHPTVIKIDTEGSEYRMVDELSNLPSYVRALAIEFHFLGLEEFQKQAIVIAKYIDDAFDVKNKVPNLKLRHYRGRDVDVGVWSR
jgi:hypothetical protein